MSSVRAVIQRYLSEVERNPAPHLEVLQKLREQVGPLPFLPRPGFVPASSLPDIGRAVDVLTCALTKVARLIFDRGAFAHLDRTADPVRRLESLDCHQKRLFLATRYDALLDLRDMSLTIIECNSGDPSGCGYVDVLLAGFLQLPALRAVAAQWGLDAPRLMAAHHRAVLAYHAEWLAQRGRQRDAMPRCAFACADDSTVLQDHECMAASYRALGTSTQRVDPRAFENLGEGVGVDGLAVDLVIRDTVDEFVLGPFREGTKTLVSAYADDRVCVVNPFSSCIGDQKAIFEVLTSPEHESLFTREEVRILRRHVPVTRALSERRVDWDGREVDLPEFARRNRESCVMKPNEGYGGYGVTVGRDVERTTWEERLEQALSDPGSFLLQRFVEVPKEPFPLVVDGDLAGTEERYTVLSLWDFGAGFGGAFVRVSQGRVVNVHQGGGLMPVVFVEA